MGGNMSKVIALAIGLILGGAGSALATSAVWKHREGNVVCVMRPSATGCANFKGWSIGISNNFILVRNSKDEAVYVKYIK
jgi:hypothetical protein